MNIELVILLLRIIATLCGLLIYHFAVRYDVV
jgi:hypothetical protein